MKLRQYLQTAAYCAVVLGTPLASAADVSYSDGEQRLRDLELRIESLESLESAGFDGVNLAGYSGCDSGCSKGCDSRGIGLR